MLEQLQNTGMTPAKAKETLRIWAELGAKDPEQLRQLLSRRAAKPLNSLAIQTTLDFVAALGGFYTGGLIGQADFTGSTVVSLVAYFFACYYFLQAASEVTALVAVWRASQRYSTDTDVLLAAMQQLAGPTSGLRVLDTVQLAVNTLKVIQALDSISGELKTLSSQLSKDTLSNLGAYLALQRAQEKYGFDPAAYGLTEKDAANIAAVFAEFDVNDDGRLELSELRTLCNKLDRDLSDGELKEALRILDEGKTGFVQFADFVEWYQGRRPDAAARQAATKSQ